MTTTTRNLTPFSVQTAQSVSPGDASDEELASQKSSENLSDTFARGGSAVAGVAVAATALDKIGPRADDDPCASVAVHVLAQDLAPDFVAILQRVLPGRVGTSGHGFKSPQEGYDTSSVWLRDFMPQTVTTATGDTRMVTSLSVNPVRSGFAGDTYIPVAPPVPNQRFFRTSVEQTRGEWRFVHDMKLIHENGNLVRLGAASKGLSVVTNKLLKDNAGPAPSRDLAAAGYRPRDEAEVRKEFCEAMLVPDSRLVILPTLPGEKTGHVDAFVLSIDGQAVVPEIPDEAIAILGMHHERHLGGAVKKALDEAAAELTKHGANVVRLPMMAPVDLTPADNEVGWNGVFFSPANSLVLQLKNKDAAASKHAFVPVHDVPKEYPADYRAMSQRYAEASRAFFQSRGYQTELVPANKLAHAYGLFRCLTRPE